MLPAVVALLGARYAGVLVDRLGHLLVLVLVSGVLACALEPAVHWLERRRIPRRVASVVLLLGILTTFAGVVASTGAAVSGQIASLSDSLPSLARSTAGTLNGLGFDVDAHVVADKFSGLRESAKHAAGRNATEAATKTGSGLADLILTLFLVYYLVADGPKLRRAVCSLLPADRQRAVLRGWEIAISKAGGYLASRFVMAAMSAIVSSIAFFLFGLPYALALGVWMGVVSTVVPVVGVYLAGALPVLVALTISPREALWVLLFLVAYQQLEQMTIAPWLTRKTLELHPAVSLVTMFGAASLVGPVGALVALPVLATVQAVLDTYVHRHEVIDDVLLPPAVAKPGTRAGGGDKRRWLDTPEEEEKM